MTEEKRRSTEEKRPGGIRVRDVEAADYEAWLPLWRGYQEFYKEKIPEATTRVTWARFLDKQEPMFAALALERERAVGMVHWLHHRTCWTVADNCYLQDLFVAPEFRGTGAGRKLIEHVCAAARAARFAKTYWLMQETNRNAMLLYDRIAKRTGFVHYEKLLE